VLPESTFPPKTPRMSPAGPSFLVLGDRALTMKIYSHINCPLYEGCLADIARRGFDRWDCSACPYKNVQGEREPETLAGYFLLLAAVCFPEEFRRYKTELRKSGEPRDMSHRWATALVEWFALEPGVDRYILRLRKEF
jgi:hypothetical protein